MPRGSRHIQEHEKEILLLIEQEKTQREIGEELGFSHKEIKEFIGWYHRKQRKLDAGISIYKKDRPPKDRVVTEQDKVSELKYTAASSIVRLDFSQNGISFFMINAPS